LETSFTLVPQSDADVTSRHLQARTTTLSVCDEDRAPPARR